jgi:hypothetical protein
VYRALEFHDSQLLAVIPLESTTRLVLMGYIHQWERTPEGWSGTGWTQQIRILIDDAKLLTQMSDLPADLSTGWIRSPGGGAPA